MATATRKRKKETGRKNGTRKRGSGPLAAIVLAAGKGTRMRSSRAKVLHELLGQPLVTYPVELARGLGADPVVAVLGHQHEAVEAVLLARFGAGAVKFVEQTEQRGTGHAVRLAMPALSRFDGATGMVMVLYGDVPLLRRETLEELVGTARRYGCLAIVTATPPDPTGYGRILRDQRGHVIGVVEQKDASPEELAITEINAGIYCGPAGFFREAVLGLGTRNAQGEYYLTDVIARAAASIGVSAIEADLRRRRWHQRSSPAGRGRADPARGASTARWQAHVTFRDPGSTVVEPGVDIGVDVELGRNVALRGRTRVGHGARIGDGVHPHRHRGGRGRRRSSRTRVATEACIGAGAAVGPFAHLRPGTRPGPRRPHRQLRRDQEDRARAGQQGQPPVVPRRRDHRREGQHRRRHHHLQLQRLREVPRPSSRTAPSSGPTRSWSRRCGSGKRAVDRRRDHGDPRRPARRAGAVAQRPRSKSPATRKRSRRTYAAKQGKIRGG